MANAPIIGTMSRNGDTDPDLPTRAGTRPRSGPSQADVAELAGVSGQTVSRVANNEDNVKPATRERVLEAMASLGYSPNNAARALRNGAFHTIGLIAHNLARTGESRTAEAVIEAARLTDHTVTLVDVASPSSQEMTRAASRLSHQSIDGLIIVRAEISNPGDLVLPPGMPVVVSDSRFEGHIPAVGADQVAGTRAAVEHLLGLGHRTVHLLGGPADSIQARVRRDAWESTLKAHHSRVSVPWQGDWTPASGYVVGKSIDITGVTAVVCANDEMAAGLLLAFHERGIRVPQDVSVVGFDDLPLSEFLVPPLTTVRQDFAAIGTRMVALLMEQMKHGSHDGASTSLLPAELVVRSSTAPPRTDGNAHPFA
ncbi:LacI family DNA-binding transcriptional regulator [Demequina sediminicola]|uniref:LacI family DNA-binding transcriptional regulator n=1 Tax=Demequina sediminicola TaxID=1095026 RepID=UPI000ADC8E71|nr:LacI family DNA-binding transcriptional regulator [Demequina sediminicola]